MDSVTPATVTRGTEAAPTRFGGWLSRPLPNRQCVLAWVVATALYIGLCALIGGPTTNDANESVYSTWAVAHGDFACAYSPVPSGRIFLPDYHPGPYVPPLWPLVSGGLAALTGVGHALAFPARSAMGPDCQHAYHAMYLWAHKTRVLYSTIGFGYVAWFALLAGAVALLRAAKRGRCGWEVAGVLLLGLTPVLWSTIITEYHPQDQMALGLILGATACALRRSWVWAGVLLGLAVASQQYALLALAPIFVVTVGRGRWRLLGAAAAAGVVPALPFLLTSRRSWAAVTIGTGNFPSYGGTAVRALHLHGPPLVLVSRVLPILAAAGIAWWARRRLGPRALEPVPLIALVTLGLSMRLVFEQNLFGYYFAPLAVLILLLEVADGRLRGQLLAWVTLASLAFNPIPWGLSYNARPWGERAGVVLFDLAVVAGVALVAWDAAHRRVRWYVVAWTAIVLACFAQWPPWSLHWPHLKPYLGFVDRPWFWQLVLVPSGIALAVWPLAGFVRRVGRDGGEPAGVVATPRAEGDAPPIAELGDPVGVGHAGAGVTVGS